MTDAMIQALFMTKVLHFTLDNIPIVEQEKEES